MSKVKAEDMTNEEIFDELELLNQMNGRKSRKRRHELVEELKDRFDNMEKQIDEYYEHCPTFG